MPLWFWRRRHKGLSGPTPDSRAVGEAGGYAPPLDARYQVYTVQGKQPRWGPWHWGMLLLIIALLLAMSILRLVQVLPTDIVPHIVQPIAAIAAALITGLAAVIAAHINLGSRIRECERKDEALEKSLTELHRDVTSARRIALISYEHLRVIDPKLQEIIRLYLETVEESPGATADLIRKLLALEQDPNSHLWREPDDEKVDRASEVIRGLLLGSQQPPAAEEPPPPTSPEETLGSEAGSGDVPSGAGPESVDPGWKPDDQEPPSDDLGPGSEGPTAAGPPVVRQPPRSGSPSGRARH